MLCIHEVNSQENNHVEARSQQSHFATLLESHPRTDATPRGVYSVYKTVSSNKYLTVNKLANKQLTKVK